MQTSSWATDVVARTVAALAAVAVPADAAPMQRYMKDVAPFLGIRTPVRTGVLKAAWRDLPPPASADDLAAAARALWVLPEREHQYAACDLLARSVPKRVDPSFLTDVVQELVVTRSWWDTVDTLRSVAVGPLVLAHRAELTPVIERWSGSGDRWLVRSSIIHQLAYKEHTDEALLFALCRRHGGDREFFVAKGIGWALRQYAYTAPDAVRAFVANTPLQPRSVREALKHIGRGQPGQPAAPSGK